MLNLVVDLIRRALTPYDDQLAELKADIEDLQRRIDNIILPGKVVAAEGDKVRVQFNNNLTPWIKWIAPAGDIIERRTPSVGEQCALLNFGGGDNSSQSWALCGVPSNSYTLPAGSADQHIIDYGNGMKIVMDRAAKTITWVAPGGVLFDTPLADFSGDVKDSTRTMAADRLIYNSHLEQHHNPPEPKQ